jgi:hypothetical protein
VIVYLSTMSIDRQIAHLDFNFGELDRFGPQEFADRFSGTGVLTGSARITQTIHGDTNHRWLCISDGNEAAQAVGFDSVPPASGLRIIIADWLMTDLRVIDINRVPTADRRGVITECHLTMTDEGPRITHIEDAEITLDGLLAYEVPDRGLAKVLTGELGEVNAADFEMRLDLRQRAEYYLAFDVESAIGQPGVF